MTRDERRQQRRERRAAYKAEQHSAGTRKTYASRWRKWVAWCEAEDLPPLEAEPEDVADFLVELADTGYARKTINGHRSAIAFHYKQARKTDPTKDVEVESTMAGIQRKTGETVGQAKALLEADAEALYRLLEAAMRNAPPRRKLPAFRLKACIMTMRDALLRVSECTAIQWEHIRWPDVPEWPNEIRWINPNPAAHGSLYIPKSKTDQLGDGVWRYLSPDTINALHAWRALNGFPETGTVFPVTPTWLMEEIRKAAKGAGLGEGYRSHSIRIGMAIDLRKRGESLENIRIAGRWKTLAMVRHYLREHEVEQDPVADYYAPNG